MKKSGRFITPAEVGFLAVLVLALILWLLAPKAPGAEAVVTRGGEELGRYTLDAPVRVQIQGANGFSLTLVVDGGTARVEDSTCPDLICQHHEPIAKVGEAIVCLPGQVSVRIEGGDRLGPDVVSG